MSPMTFDAQKSLNVEWMGNKSILVRNAYKCYSDIVSMKGLNMTVPCGSIYGLLGPSGCGKTTLLNCILGQTPLDAGNIYLKVQRLSDISYMPQDITLHHNLTARQTFIFYGKLYGIGEEDIKTRIKELDRILCLPRLDEQIKNLSGGEQRRLSFGVALFHDPKIMILDEPTVGVDPVIRESIWDHLVKLSANGKTIVITTHYIEEATRANVVGLMRNGTLVGEDSPSSLISKQNVSTLEEAFLSLCCAQESGNVFNNVDHDLTSFTQPRPNLKNDTFSWRRFRALTYKNGAFLYKDHTFLFFTFFLPLVQTVFYNLCIGHSVQDVNFAIVNDEMKNCGSYVHHDSCFLNDVNYTKLSCTFIENLRYFNKRLVHYPNLESSKVALNANDVSGILYFAHNYTKSLRKRVQRRANLYDMNSSSVQVYSEFSNYIIRQKIKRDVYKTFEKTINEATKQCNKNMKSVSSPIVIQKVGKVQITEFIHSSAPGFIALLAFYFPMILSTGLMLTEKDEGIMSRIMAAGVTFEELLFSMFCLQTFVHIIQSAIAMFMMFTVFDNPILMENFWSVVAIVMLTGYQGMFAGILAAAFSNSYTMATHINMGTNVLFTCLCGLIWPMEGAHPVLRAFNKYLPLSASSETIGNLALRGWSIKHPAVQRGFVLNSFWIIAFAVPLLFFNSMKKDMWIKRK
ncbi:ABC transporter G family member 23-like isoform X2 [Adelges cooleyi]|uniref:ABC transporter G family member 23-like isoform X2 n=1 Tax=Adelges cooleyi TaxID=133065 RepID=UPI00217FF7FA|nr:ABC transporter G family member 23-like isoform X2 [Adelges cooleyi]